MKNYLLCRRLSAATVIIILLNSVANSQTLLIENFNYPAGTTLTANGWSAHSGEGNNPIKVNITGLSFTGYPSSNIGLSVRLDNNGEDVNRTFSTISSGSIYCAFLVRIDTISEEYFMHLAGSPVGTNYKGRVNVSGTGNSFSFGLVKGTGTIVYTSGSSYSTGVTYLIVLKYSIIEGVKNDQVSLFIISGSIPGTEPSNPSVGPVTDSSEDLSNVSSVALRQYSTVLDIVIDGIRIARTWEDVVSSLTLNSSTHTRQNNLVYPVPATSEITIDNCIDITEIEIFNLSGEKIISLKNNRNTIVKIPVNQLIQGLYIIRLKYSGGDRYLKFVKS